MAIDFYEKELSKLQDEFNSTYSGIIVCDVRTRCNVILSIVAMGLLVKQIREASNKNDIGEMIQRFDRQRQLTRNILKLIQKDTIERRNYVHLNERTQTNGCGDDRTDRRLPQVWEPIHRHLVEKGV